MMSNNKFIEFMPKIELHAHLNGSLSNSTLKCLNKLKYGADKPKNEFYRMLSGDVLSLDECFKKFAIAHDLTDTKELLASATEMVVKDFMNDNVIYLEIRTGPKNTKNMTKTEYLETVIETIETCNSMFAPSILVKLIPSIDRSKGVIEANENMDIILKLKKQHPSTVVGVDLSGNPLAGKFSDFAPVLQKARDNGLKLALHCGESDENDEVLCMLQFGMDRLGHGTYIDLSDKTIRELLTSKMIPIECCLTSNIKCGTVSSALDHHFKKFFDLSHPVLLCTDDFGVFDTTLTDELKLAQVHFDMSNDDLLNVTKDAIFYSFASDKEKLSLLKIVDKFESKYLIQ